MCYFIPFLNFSFFLTREFQALIAGKTEWNNTYESGVQSHSSSGSSMEVTNTRYKYDIGMFYGCK